MFLGFIYAAAFSVIGAVRPVKGALIPAAMAESTGARSSATTAALLRAVRAGAFAAGAAIVAAARVRSTDVVLPTMNPARRVPGHMGTEGVPGPVSQAPSRMRSKGTE